MHILLTDEDNLIILIPNNLYDKEKSQTMKKIKSFLLTYNKIYHFLSHGFYQVEVSFNEMIGTILEIIKLDEFEFESSTIDLKIVLTGKKKMGLKLEDPMFLKDYYIYQDKFCVSDKQLNYKLFLQLIEHANITLQEETIEFITNGKKKSSLNIIREQ